MAANSLLTTPCDICGGTRSIQFNTPNCISPGESSNNHPQCSFSPLTERRLINLENQLSSLVAMQLMRLNEPMHVKSSSPPPPPLPMQPAPTTTTPLSPTVHQVPSSQTQAALTDMIPRSNELRREDPGATDEFHPTSRVRQSRRMSNVDCVESHQPRSKSRRATNEVPIKRSTGEHPPSTLTSARKPEDTNRLQTICRLNSDSTVQTNQTAGQEMDTYRPTASPGEDHPPGAPKRPAGNMKVAKPSSSHPT
ncbi:hypothetical protein D915_006840 [Fasciola hepatica]|uniref:Uncharacterized protein n=1 Tax=Fasciola hepatica TaxID=6192 RepID=A0A4E0R9G0_FASHE|nr:hypothetical protein D915_006840 [Fasciola hepatica]